MIKNNKMVIAIFVLIIVLLGAIGAMIGVLAAAKQSIGNTFNINYSIENNIAVKITSSYQIAGEGKINLDEIRFNTNEEPQTKYSTLPIIKLNADQPYVDFSIRIDPLSTEQTIVATAYWNDIASNIKNVKLISEYHVFGETQSYNSETDGRYPFGASHSYPIILANNWNYIEFNYRFEIIDINKSAYVVSSNAGGLTFNVSYGG